MAKAGGGGGRGGRSWGYGNGGLGAIADRMYGGGWDIRGNRITKTEARKRAVDSVLEGQRNKQEALEWLETFGPRGNVGFTAYGEAITPRTFAAAIKAKWG